jgi:hypothetical protein
MVGEEGPPGLRWLGAPLRHQAGHGALSHVDPELNELAMSARGAPQRVGGSDARDQSSDLSVDRRPTGFSVMIATARDDDKDGGALLGMVASRFRAP